MDRTAPTCTHQDLPRWVGKSLSPTSIRRRQRTHALRIYLQHHVPRGVITYLFATFALPLRIAHLAQRWRTRKKYTTIYAWDTTKKRSNTAAILHTAPPRAAHYGSVCHDWQRILSKWKTSARHNCKKKITSVLNGQQKFHFITTFALDFEIILINY